MLNVIMLNVIMQCVGILSDIMQSAYMLSIFYAENETVMLNIIMMDVYAQRCHSVCPYAECYYAECCSTKNKSLQLKRSLVCLSERLNLVEDILIGGISVIYSTSYAKCCYAKYLLF
jgi:hypothetical protein